MRKWNVPTNRAQRVHEKNGAICLVIMLTPRVIVIKLSKMAHFLYFLLLEAKNSHSLGKIFTCIWKTLFSSFRKCYELFNLVPSASFHYKRKGKKFFKIALGTRVWIIGFWATIAKVSTLETTEKFFYISSLNISWTVTPKPINHFLKDLNNIYQVHVDILL